MQISAGKVEFVILIFDKIFRQNTVVNENMLDEYIRNKFKKFYRKYKDNIYITKDDNKLWILVFSIMIFENYNRGSIMMLGSKAPYSTLKSSYVL